MQGRHCRPGFMFAKRVTLTAARLDRLALRVRREGTRSLGAFLAAALDADEMSRITVALYGQTPLRASTRGLDAWEQEWYADSLPPSPARLLVAAAGTGREVHALRAMGYAVDAFEPADGQADLIGRGPDDIVVAATYGDLVLAAAGDTSSPAAPFVEQHYDAVILGWGSLTHLLDRREQVAVLAACDAVCPRGPILASFWPAVSGTRQSRGHAVGRRLGRRVASWRGLSAAEGPDEHQGSGIGFAFNVGFTRRFSREDMVSLAAEVGRDVALFGFDPYAHATLTPTP